MDSHLLFLHSRALRASSLQLIVEARAARQAASAASARARALLARVAKAEAQVADDRRLRTILAAACK